MFYAEKWFIFNNQRIKFQKNNFNDCLFVTGEKAKKIIMIFI